VIDLKDAQAQMERMMQLDFGPKGREQRQEVLAALCQARTAAICQMAVSDWMGSENAKFPKPGQIRAIIASLNVTETQVAEDARRSQEWARDAKLYAGKRREVWEMTAEELDGMANFQSGLPTEKSRRAAALEAWRQGGPKGLNDWRVATAEKRPIKPIAPTVTFKDGYHGDF
jgi:hypothetical protein